MHDLYDASLVSQEFMLYLSLNKVGMTIQDSLYQAQQFFSQSFNKTIVWPRRESILHCIVLNKWNNSCQNSRSIWTTLSVTWWFLGCPAQCQELDWWVPASSAYSVIVSKRPNNLTSMNHQWCVEKAILLTFLCFPPLFNK